MQKEGKRFAVSAGGFQAGVDSLDALHGEPVKQLLEAGQSVGKTRCLSLPSVLMRQTLNFSFEISIPRMGFVMMMHSLRIGWWRRSNLQIQAQLNG